MFLQNPHFKTDLLVRPRAPGLVPEGLVWQGRGGWSGGAPKEGGDQRTGRSGTLHRRRGRGRRGPVKLCPETHLLTILFELFHINFILGMPFKKN